MGYLALARKWRPTQFDQVVGQSHVLTALGNALDQNRLHHAYLFSGTRGVGKTTIGRLFAKGLNCETGITSTPCGRCDTCQEIDQGRFVDLLEIDAASRTKVEDTRDLLDNVQYKPARGRFKVYLIDEVHMLSRHSFNALLKTLEEPPEYVKFLLATTDPQKLPITILSRCLQFHLKPISVDNIHQQLDYILEHEQVSSEHRALGMIAHAADGSMRDALSLTDQAIALCNGQVLTDSVAHMLGTLDTDQALHLLEAISAKQPKIAMDCLSVLAQNGVDWGGLLSQLSSQLHRLAMYQALPETLDKTQPDAEKIELLSLALSPQDIQLYYQIALKGRQDLPFAPSEKIGIEMVILRMMAFRPVTQPQASMVLNQVTQPEPAPPVDLSLPTSQMASQSSLPPETMPPQSPGSKPELSSDIELNQGQVAVDTVEQVNVTSQEQPQPSSPSVRGLRHQLRSQRKGSNQASTPKKINASSAQTSVLDRVAQRQMGTMQVSPVSKSTSIATPAVDKSESYQWRPTLPQKQQVKSTSVLTPTLVKKALEHEKTPDMVNKLTQACLQQSQWAQLIEQLDVAKMTEQLALNSHFDRQGSSIMLTLRHEQAHLNSERARSELITAINSVLDENCDLDVEVGLSGETPLELREKLYQTKLQQAFSSLKNDTNVQFIEQRFGAQLDSDSVRPI
ncbi:DNA polymerase III subunit gamma/tau [Vibrio hepatarius]|uniref:DNA polymerase III subunit gamma/tau n=1 Tax=Vibrio hepatarius TaxID=171383 RepID=UPI001C08F2BC|nr:DNA polymerase III subunit gamma/tau [Vibrio hepatarius]MBU2896475.1 DNA polymerase III subunit gamma/tau [Vibrio hepatarius]